MSHRILRSDQVVVSNESVLLRGAEIIPSKRRGADSDDAIAGILAFDNDQGETQNDLYRYLKRGHAEDDDNSGDADSAATASDIDIESESIASDTDVAAATGAPSDTDVAIAAAESAAATPDSDAATAATTAAAESAAAAPDTDTGAPSDTDAATAAAESAAATPDTDVVTAAAEDDRQQQVDRLNRTVTEQRREISSLQSDLGAAQQQLQAASNDDSRQQREQQLRQAEEEQKQIIADAETEREKLLAVARTEAESIRQDAHTAGHDEGFTKGYEQVEPVIARLKEITGRIVHKRQEILDGAESQIVELVLLIARKVIKIATKQSRLIAAENVRQALELVRKKGEVTIRINPADLKLSADSLQNITNAIERDGTIRFVEDTLIERGGCLIETEFGEIDARIHSQILEIENKIRT